MDRIPPALSIVAPAYNEADNIRPLVAALAAALETLGWELIVVDDDSPDGTARIVEDLRREGAPVRVLRRIGRRGLSSAVVEGVLAAEADVIAVMDADMQHDERLLPAMHALIAEGQADLVVASRHAEGGGTGDWNAGRRRMSDAATRIARRFVPPGLSDPMSGFFAADRRLFEAALHDLSQRGYKILLDLVTASGPDLRIRELPYVFRVRDAGESKLDGLVALEFLSLLVDRATGGLVPPRFVIFAGVGGLGVFVHMAMLGLFRDAGLAFLPAQSAATLAAMTFNFVANNAVTYRANRLTGWRAAGGYLLFCAACSLGAIANVGVANLAMESLDSWALAGIAGAAMSAVFNFAIADRFVWTRPRRRRWRASRAR